MRHHHELLYGALNASSINKFASVSACEGLVFTAKIAPATFRDGNHGYRVAALIAIFSHPLTQSARENTLPVSVIWPVIVPPMAECVIETLVSCAERNWKEFRAHRFQASAREKNTFCSFFSCAIHTRALSRFVMEKHGRLRSLMQAH